MGEPMPDPFIDATDISDYLGRDVSADAGAIIALDAACDICRSISGQDFNAGSANIALDGNGGDCLLLPQRPVNTAGTLTINGVAETDFMVTTDGRLLRGTAGGVPRPVFPVGRQNVTVTYTYGYDEVPRDVRMVALSIASRLIVQGVAVEESLGDARVKYAVAGSDLTRNEERILGKYRAARSF
jgi:hypothetical protein